MKEMLNVLDYIESSNMSSPNYREASISQAVYKWLIGIQA
jgi:hypothetical protein